MKIMLAVLVVACLAACDSSTTTANVAVRPNSGKGADAWIRKYGNQGGRRERLQRRRWGAPLRSRRCPTTGTVGKGSHAIWLGWDD